MKKQIFFLVLALALSGCSKTPTPPPDINDGLGISAFNRELLFGTWELYKVNHKLTINTLRPSVLTFRCDGEFISTGEFGRNIGGVYFEGWHIYCNSPDAIFSLNVQSITSTTLMFISLDFDIGTFYEMRRIK